MTSSAFRLPNSQALDDLVVDARCQPFGHKLVDTSRRCVRSLLHRRSRADQPETCEQGSLAVPLRVGGGALNGWAACLDKKLLGSRIHTVNYICFKFAVVTMFPRLLVAWPGSRPWSSCISIRTTAC